MLFFFWEWREGIVVVPQVIAAVEGTIFFQWWFFNLLLVRECWLTHNVQLWISCEELCGGNIDSMEIHTNPAYNLFWSFCSSSSLGRQRKNHKTVTCYHVCGYGIAHCFPLSIISIPKMPKFTFLLQVKQKSQSMFWSGAWRLWETEWREWKSMELNPSGPSESIDFLSIALHQVHFPWKN